MHPARAPRKTSLRRYTSCAASIAMGSDLDRSPDPGWGPRRNARAARLGFSLDYTLGIVLGCLAMAGFVWIAAIGGVALNTLLKIYFARPRPPIATAIPAGYSAFPSGHAMSSLVVYGVLAYLIVRGAPGRPILQTLIILAGLVWADFCVLVY